MGRAEAGIAGGYRVCEHGGHEGPRKRARVVSNTAITTGAPYGVACCGRQTVQRFTNLAPHSFISLILSHAVHARRATHIGLSGGLEEFPQRAYYPRAVGWCECIRAQSIEFSTAKSSQWFLCFSFFSSQVPFIYSVAWMGFPECMHTSGKPKLHNVNETWCTISCCDNATFGDFNNEKACDVSRATGLEEQKNDKFMKKYIFFVY